MRKAQAAASVRFIFATILLDTLGLGILIPIMPDVVRRFGHTPEFVNTYYGYFISTYALMQFFASPLLGAASDRFGRRPVLLVSLLGAGLDYLVMAFAPNLTILFLGRVIAGLSGASQTVASSYMADISNDENRSANFGMIGAAFGVGFILGPALGGLLGHLGPRAPFLAAAGLNLLNAAFGFFVLPESLPKSARRKVELTRLNPVRSILRVLSPSPFVSLVWIYFLWQLAGQAHPSTWTLYTEHKFGWSVAEVGVSLSFVGVFFGLGQAWLTRVIIPRTGEPRAVRLGLAVSVTAFLCFATATRSWMMYAIMPLFSISGVAAPAIQSLIARHVPPSQQGELQGSLFALASLTSIIGPLIYTHLFALFTSPAAPFPFSGIAYSVASLMTGAALALSVFSRQADTIA